MSTAGRLQDALYALLYDVEVSQSGEVQDGLLKKMGLTFEQVSSVIDPIRDTAFAVIDPFWRAQVDDLRATLLALVEAAEAERTVRWIRDLFMFHNRECPALTLHDEKNCRCGLVNYFEAANALAEATRLAREKMGGSK